MLATLDELIVGGIQNNRAFCMRILSNNDFQTGNFDTSFIGKNIDTLLGYDEYE